MDADHSVRVWCALGAKARDRAEIERQIIRLRYEITALDPSDAAGRAALNRELADTGDKVRVAVDVGAGATARVGVAVLVIHRLVTVEPARELRARGGAVLVLICRRAPPVTHV
jgi:hypothetical protein